MVEKQWTDQPDEVKKAEVLLSFHANGRIVEVRREVEVADPRYYVSAGNLFGSQTILCPFEDTLWAVLRETQNSKPKLPKDAVLLPDPSGEKEGK